MRVTGLAATAVLIGGIEAGGIAAERPVAPEVAAHPMAAVIQPIEQISGATDRSGLPTPAFMRAVVAWLAAQFDLPPTDVLPSVVLAPQRQMAAMRYGQLPATTTQPDVAAIYNDGEQTIYLPEGWTGRTPADLSLLVHEMVHHLQNAAGMTYDCAEAREKQAYLAQDRWLALTESNLATEFGIDPMTLLVRTNCIH
jgi:hypothetical protein